MGLNKDKIIFDAADLATSDLVGSSIVGANGTTVVTTTGTALDINIASSSGMGIYAEDAAHVSADLGQLILAVRNDTQGSMVSANGDYGALQLDAVGRLRVVADLDFIGDLLADDAVDAENPLKVGSQSKSGLLTAISASGDKANLLSDMYRRIFTNDAPNVAGGYGTASVTNAAAAIVAASAGRQSLLIQNNSATDFFVGTDASVTTANGVKVAKGGSIEVKIGQNINLFAIAASAGPHNARYLQLG
jgi:hypothetical protein